MGYLNINSIRNKIIDLREIVKYLELDSSVISETKNNESFPSQQFAMDGLLLGKIGTAIEAVCQNLSERVLFVKDKHIWGQVPWSAYVQNELVLI